VRRAPGAEAYGQIHEITFGESFEGLDGLHAWVAQCLRKGRLLAFGSNLMWAWWIGIAFVGFYGLLALLFPRGVEKCAITFEQSPEYSVLTAVLVTLLTPLLMVLVAITVVGAPVLGL